MTDEQFNQRPYDVFVSYSHEDRTLVEPLVRWLELAGLEVWWDTNRLVAGETIHKALPAGLARARAALFCISQSWNDSIWCEDEFGVARQEKKGNRRYQIIAVRLEDCEMQPFIKNAKYIVMRALDTRIGAEILCALVPDPSPRLGAERDVFWSRSWRPIEAESAERVGLALYKHNFRLIGDSPDHKKFDDQSRRINHFIESCGALVAVLPFRDDAANGFTSKFIIKEVEIARALQRQYLLFAADGVRLDPELIAGAMHAMCFPIPDAADDSGLERTVLEFDEDYRPAPRLARSFFATSLRREPEETQRAIDVIQQVTKIPCMIGQRLQGQQAQVEIIRLIEDAEFMLADISANDLNSMIEAGIARGAGTLLHFLSRVPDSRELQTRFMFRDMEVNWYSTALERLGFAHRIARNYRRRVFVPTAN
jgi:hypothetical protein